MKNAPLLLLALVLPAAPALSAHALAPAGKVTCAVRHAPLSEAEMALFREDFGAASAGFSALSTTAPDLSRNGTVRVLLEQNKLDEAKAIADSWLASAPASTAAMETMSEFLLRDGRIPQSGQMALNALKADPCNARAHMMLSAEMKLAANFATSVQQATLAHSLDPVDPDIRRAWIAGLSRSQQLAEYLALSKDQQSTSAEERRRLAVAMAFTSAHAGSSCHVTKAFDQANLPLERIMDGPHRVAGIALRVQFNNGKRRLLELDSGASGLLLSRGAASSLGLVRDVTSETSGIGDKGNVATGIAQVASLRIGDLEFANCPVRILEKRTALDIDGLIGADVFHNYLVTIDYPGSMVRLAPLPPRPDEPAKQAQATPDEAADATPHWHDRYIAPEMKDWTPIFREGHDLLLPVSIGETRERLFIVDTGAGTMLISDEAARAVTKVHGDSFMRIRGISGDVNKVYSTSNFVLRFARLEEKVDSMTAIDTSGISHNLGVQVSGFLGAPVLQLMATHIDYRDNLIKFDYKPR